MTEAGHNNPPTDAELYKGQINELRERIETFPDITVDNEGDANDLIQLTKKLAKEIDNKRKTLKQPHLDAGREIDGTFNPLKAEAEATAKPLKDKLSAHLREQERIARAKAAEAARIAEEERKKAEEERQHVMPADEAEVTAKAEAAELAASAAQAQAENARTAKGSYGLRASGLRTKKEVVITDPVAIVRHYHKHPQVIELCHKLAKADVRSGMTEANIEGIAIKEVREIA